MRKLVVAAIAFTVLGVQCGSCNEKAIDEGGHDGGTPLAQLTPEQKAQVLAKVGDRTITLGDYAAALEHMDQFDRMRYASPERRKELLDEMIEVELLAREAEAKGYDKDPIAQMEMRAILRDAMFKDAHKGAPLPTDIPDDEVRSYYDSHKDDYKDPERRRLSLIVLKDEGAAKAVLASALATTTAAQWGELVKTKSTDAQAKANVPLDLAGDFGMVSPPGDPRGENPRVPEPVRTAAFEIGSVGQVLPRVVAGGDGRFYVVRLASKVDAHARSYGEAERSIRVKLSNDKMKQKEDEMLAQLRTQYPVTIDENELAKVKVDLPGIDAGH
jgi:hypothetical protein